MYPKHLAPMSISEVRKLKVGDEVFIYYSKDDDEDNEIYNEICEVSEITCNEIVAGELWNISVPCWFNAKQQEEFLAGNEIDTSRGYAYFFYPNAVETK